MTTAFSRAVRLESDKGRNVYARMGREAGEPGLERMWNKRRLIAEESGTKGSSSEHVYITTGMAQ